MLTRDYHAKNKSEQQFDLGLSLSNDSSKHNAGYIL